MNIAPNEFKPPGDCKKIHKVLILRSMARCDCEKIMLKNSLGFPKNATKIVINFGANWM